MFFIETVALFLYTSYYIGGRDIVSRLVGSFAVLSDKHIHLCKVIEGDLKMKKLIALALMVVCAAGFSLGCKDKAKPVTESTTPEATAPAEGADAAPATDAPAAE